MSAIGEGGSPPVYVVNLSSGHNVSIVPGVAIDRAVINAVLNAYFGRGAPLPNPAPLNQQVYVLQQAMGQAAPPPGQAQPAQAAAGGQPPERALPPELVQQMIQILAQLGANMMAPQAGGAARGPFIPNQPPQQPKAAPREQPAASATERRSTQRGAEASAVAGGAKPGRDGAPPPREARGERGFTPQQRADMIERVLIASFLLQLGASSSKGLSLAPTQEMHLLQRLNLLNRDLAQLHSEMNQAGKEMTPKQAQDFAARLGQKQEALKTILQEVGSSTSLSTGQIKPEAGELLEALAHLQSSSDGVAAKLEKELGGELQQLASRLAALPKGAEVADPSLAKLAAQAAPLSLTAEGRALAMQEGSASVKALAALANSSVVSSAAQLGAVTEKLQNRQFNFPVAINLFYPISKESQGTIGATKTETGEKRGGGQVGAGGSAKQFPMPMVLVPAGIALLGDPFGEGRADELPLRALHLEAYLVGVMPVTNEQFAEWLSEAYENKQIKLTEKGVVIDHLGRVVCNTAAAALTSQIQTVISGEALLFAPLPKAERHPVVQVTVHGAELFCKGNGFRLPTEAEWEKAAGMSVAEEGKEPVKFRYGCGRNEIGPSWANYRQTFKEEGENRTTPAGFFNGETFFTKERQDLQSRLALSPYGCFDMSGNVRQWVQDEAEGGQITKGGSYNTPPYELRVSARLPADAVCCHADIGFRVALSMS